MIPATARRPGMGGGPGPERDSKRSTTGTRPGEAYLLRPERVTEPPRGAGPSRKSEQQQKEAP